VAAHRLLEGCQPVRQGCAFIQVEEVEAFPTFFAVGLERPRDKLEMVEMVELVEVAVGLERPRDKLEDKED